MESSSGTVIGFSTGAIAYSDFRRGLQLLRDRRVAAVEISALRMAEWAPLMEALSDLDLSAFDYVSVHLPSAMHGNEEALVAGSLKPVRDRRFPLILHPDAIQDFGLWREFGDLLYIENMDKRKLIGRTEPELGMIFQALPDARLCFDIGHAAQVDPTMAEAYFILKSYRGKIAQVHVSEVNSRSKHDSLSYVTIQSFREVARMIPAGIPIILETPVPPESMQEEIARARFALALDAASRIGAYS
jgi:hypothetical protein